MSIIIINSVKSNQEQKVVQLVNELKDIFDNKLGEY